MTAIIKAIRPRRFTQVSPTLTAGGARLNMKQFLEEIREEMEQNYLEVKESNEYRRTGELLAGWSEPDALQVSADGSVGTLINEVPYAVYVQGPRGGGRGPGQRQSRHNRSLGWKSITDVANAKRKQYLQVMNRAYKGGIIVGS